MFTQINSSEQCFDTYAPVNDGPINLDVEKEVKESKALSTSTQDVLDFDETD